MLMINLQILTVFHPHGNLPSALTSSTVVAAKSSGNALSTLSVDQYDPLPPTSRDLVFK